IRRPDLRATARDHRKDEKENAASHEKRNRRAMIARRLDATNRTGSEEELCRQSENAWAHDLFDRIPFCIHRVEAPIDTVVSLEDGAIVRDVEPLHRHLEADRADFDGLSV